MTSRSLDGETIVGHPRRGFPSAVVAPGATSAGTDCYLRGTQIATESGDVAIEDIRIGDRVLTARGESRPVRGMHQRGVDVTHHRAATSVWPVLVRAGAFAEAIPTRDLWLSPGHHIVFEGALVPVGKLLNGRTVAQIERPHVEYWHVELDSHDVILAEGLSAESYLDHGNRNAFANDGGGAVADHPEFGPQVWDGTCLPLAYAGAHVVRARQHLLDRAASLGHTITAEPKAHITSGERRIEAMWISPERFAFVIPEGWTNLVLRSRTFVPAQIDAIGGDWRTLGLCVGRLELDGVGVDMADDAAFGEGWYGYETHANDHRQRWTNGAVKLPDGTRLVLIDLAGRGYYWSERGENVVTLFG